MGLLQQKPALPRRKLQLRANYLLLTIQGVAYDRCDRLDILFTAQQSLRVYVLPLRDPQQDIITGALRRLEISTGHGLPKSLNQIIWWFYPICMQAISYAACA